MTEIPTQAQLPRAERWSSLVACSLVLLTPFVIFVRHHDYGLLQAEVLVAAAIIGALGLVFGVLLATLPAAARVAIAAGSVVLFVDLQLNWIDSGSRALLLLIGIAIPLWFARDGLGRILTFVSAIMILATLPIAPGDGFLHEASYEIASPASRELPPIVHLVLDEHTALDAIPRRFDPDGRIANALSRTYTELGFRVFARAFSRHFTTAPSLSHLVNLSAGDQSLAYYDTPTKSVRGNAYFEEMSRRGYRIAVLQTDYIDFCKHDDSIRLDRCSSYTLESPKAIEDAPLGVVDKARTISGMYLQLSTLFKAWRQQYKSLAMRANENGVELPDWPLRAGRLSTVSSMQILPKLHDTLSRAQPGTLYFAHLLLPHFPYAYDRACTLRPTPVEWLTYKAPALRPTRNNPGTRAERYALYLEQLECTTRRLGEMLESLLATDALKHALVIVHGDHGSRINLTTPNQANLHRMGPQDFADAFATHFAVRMPGAQPGVDRREIAIDELLAAIVREGTIPDGRDWIRSPDVIITGAASAPDVREPMIWDNRRTARSDSDGGKKRAP